MQQTKGVLLLFSLASIIYLCDSHQVSCAPSINGQKWSTLYGSNPGSVTVKSGTTVILDMDTVHMSGGITVEAGATLYFDWQRSISLTTQYITVKGKLYIGTESCPFENQVTIQLTNSGSDKILDGMNTGRKVIAVGSGGVLELHGSKGKSPHQSWTQLSQTASKGATTLHLSHSVATNDQLGWQVGDHLVVSPTDFSPLQTEEVVIKKIIDANTVEITAGLSHTHYGDFTKGVDQRAEVALLSRNIVVRGSSTLGAHMMVLAGTTKAAIEGVEFFLVGQDQIGRYPLHFHLAGSLQNAYARYNSIHESQFRCITVHATQNVILESNVAYNNLGHCYYTEDGVEENNSFVRNLAVLTKPKQTGARIGSDNSEGVSSFWITNNNNRFVDNVAAGSYGTGFWMHCRLGARGLSAGLVQYKNVHPCGIPILEFRGNRAHSCEQGFQLESVNFDQWDNPKTKESPPAQYAPRQQTIIDKFSSYKIRFRGVWARCNDFVVQSGTFADCYEAVQLATSGAHPLGTSFQLIKDSIFVGVSDNKGDYDVDARFQGWDGVLKASYPQRGEGFVGWKLYDGGQGCDNCTFKSYPTPSAGGKVHTPLGVRQYNNAQMASTNSIQRSHFVDVNSRTYFIDRTGDGGKIVNFRDIDGSVSGHSGAVIVPEWGYYTTSKCTSGNTKWHACPHKYNQLWVMDMDHSSATLNNKMVITRNQQESGQPSDYSLTLNGFGDAGIFRYQPAVSVGASYLISFKSFVTNNLALQMVNARISESVSIMICYPAGTSISKVSRGLIDGNGSPGLPKKNSGTAISRANSQNDQNVKNGNAYYWDASRFMLFVTVTQRNDNNDVRYFCPKSGCDYLYIQANVPNGASPRNCMGSYSGSDSIKQTSGEWLAKHF